MLRSLSQSLLRTREAIQWMGRCNYQKRKLREVLIWVGDVVEVEYCTVEDYYQHYRILKEKLMTEFADLIEVRGNPYGMPRRSAFEVIWRSLYDYVMMTSSLCRRGDDLQEELWSKFSSGEPSTADATYAVAEVIVYDLEQVFKKYGVHKGRHITKYPSTIDEMDYYRDLDLENETIRTAKLRQWPSNNRGVTIRRERRYSRRSSS